MPMITDRLPIIKIKIGIAKILYRIIRVFTSKNNFIIQRKGIRFEIDLGEGIDLSLYLFGNFQNHVYHNKWFDIQPDDIILDIGANFGIIALNYAKEVPNGQVYAFEPTHYALQKFKRNLSLNPELANHITVLQKFVSDHPAEKALAPTYSSWKVDGSDETGEQIHDIHKGVVKSTEGVSTTTIDVFVEQQHLKRVDHIKIDTDGHEYEVLQGAIQTLNNFKPTVIFEIGRYIIEERGIDYRHFEELFHKVGYILKHSTSGQIITWENHTSYIPKLGTIDIIALPI
jgi:FkbM family methyltransferase